MRIRYTMSSTIDNMTLSTYASIRMYVYLLRMLAAGVISIRRRSGLVSLSKYKLNINIDRTAVYTQGQCTRYSAWDMPHKFKRLASSGNMN